MTAPTFAAARTANRMLPAWIGYLALGAVAIVAYLTVVPADLVAGWYNAFAFAGAMAIVTHVARTRPATATSHLLLAGALVLLGLGDVAFTLLDLAGLEVFPSIADGLYLAGVALLVVAVWHRYGRHGDISVLVEAAILMVGGALVLWEIALEPLLADTSDPVATAIAAAYPVLDILLLGILVRVLLTPGQLTPAVRLLTAAMACYLAADTIYAAQVLTDTYVGGLLDAGWLAGYVLFAASVLHPSSANAGTRAAPGALDTRPRLLVLAPVLVAAPVLTILAGLGGEPQDIVAVGGGSLAVSALVIVRLAIALRALRSALDQRHQLQARLEHQASHDALTGLANRSVLAARLTAELSGSRPVAVLFIDLDDFKAVNDTFGHEDGDRLLVEVARRISANLRPSDLGARLGGDEFAVLLDGIADARTAEAAAQRLLAEIRTPIDLGSHVALPRASIGIALGRDTGADGADEVMRNADIAMYLAKGQGKDRYQVFDARLHADVLSRLHVRADLEQAIENHEFVLHYQPILDLASGRVTGAEALVRWEHPVRGLVPPGEFIEVAETTGLIVPLGRWVLREALSTTKRWQESLGRPDLGVSVNVSPRQLEHPGFANDVHAALTATGIRPAALTLEVTESAILDMDTTLAMLQQLKRLGVRIAVDDFGTGYSSLSYVGRLPIDELKIDRAFVASLGHNTKEAALAASVIELGGKLELVTVAEGIEDESQLRQLQALGCDLAQGFLFARPLADRAFEAFARSAESGPALSPLPAPSPSTAI